MPNEDIVDQEKDTPALEQLEQEDVSLATGVADDEEKYIPPEPTKAQLKAAKTVLAEMEKRINEYSADTTVSALVQLVDVIDPFLSPEKWQASDEDEYVYAPVIEAIAKKLLVGCRHLSLSPTHLICLFRNKDKWMEGERPKRSDSTKMSGRAQYLLEGVKVVLEINYHHWLTLNPLQKVQTVYHELRRRDAGGKANTPDFIGYLDELELFGMRTFHELVALNHAVSLAEDIEFPHQLPLFPEPEGIPN